MRGDHGVINREHGPSNQEPQLYPMARTPAPEMALQPPLLRRVRQMATPMRRAQVQVQPRLVPIFADLKLHSLM